MTPNIPAWLYAAMRAAAQAIIPSFGGALTLLDRGVVIELLAGVGASVAYGLVVGAIRWLETRTGDGILASLARSVAKWVMLGLSKYQPVYAQASPDLTASAVTYTEVGRHSAERIEAPALRE